MILDLFLNQLEVCRENLKNYDTLIKKEKKKEVYCKDLYDWIVKNLSDVEKLTIYIYVYENYNREIHVNYNSSGCYLSDNLQMLFERASDTN